MLPAHPGFEILLRECFGLEPRRPHGTARSLLRPTAGTEPCCSWKQGAAGSRRSVPSQHLICWTWAGKCGCLARFGKV